MVKRDNLERVKWEKRPLLISVSDAYRLTRRNHRFYMVTWWDDEPAGFSQFEFVGFNSGAYEIKITDERGETIKALASAEWVLVFQHINYGDNNTNDFTTKIQNHSGI